MEGIIYLAENVKNSKVYIGKTTKCLEHRIKKHYYDGKTDNNYFHRALNKYGADNFQWTIIDTAETEERLNQLEKLYIKIMQSNKKEYGYNGTNGGQGISGLKLTSEHKAKISAACIGKKRTPEAIAKTSVANTGKKLTPEHKAKMSAAKIGKKHTPETKAKISATHIGKKLTSETRAKLSVANTGKKLTPEHKAKMSAAKGKKVKCIETNIVYYSIKEAAIKNNLKSSGGITNVCRNRVKTAGGYHWQYVN